VIVNNNMNRFLVIVFILPDNIIEVISNGGYYTASFCNNETALA